MIIHCFKIFLAQIITVSAATLSSQASWLRAGFVSLLLSDFFDVSAIKGFLERIENEGRYFIKSANKIPSDDSVCAWCAHNRGITYRGSENKKVSKVLAERYENVRTYAVALKSIELMHPGYFYDGDEMWNMDKTAVNGEFWNKVRVFGSLIRIMLVLSLKRAEIYACT